MGHIWRRLPQKTFSQCRRSKTEWMMPLEAEQLEQSTASYLNGTSPLGRGPQALLEDVATYFLTDRYPKCWLKKTEPVCTPFAACSGANQTDGSIAGGEFLTIRHRAVVVIRARIDGRRCF
jgi:hypothetical protein